MSRKQLLSFFQLSVLTGIVWFLTWGALIEFPELFGQARDQLESAAELPAPAVDLNEDRAAESALVVRVIDGDTVELDSGERVRYIGIDTPELNSRSASNAECYAAESSEANRQWVEGVVVRLERDRSNRDRYGRLLRYVWVDETLVNEWLVQQGFATQITYPPDKKYEDRLLAAQAAARDQSLGLWQDCVPGL
ncbi:MAG: thermonuclease family protein [Patescibacteria group bacterium]